MEELLNNYSKLWDEWEVRGCILLSLLLQIFLMFFASCRKQKTKMANILRPFVWLAYLMADSVAMFTLGLLSRTIDPSKNNFIKISLSPATSHSYNALFAYWAPFLLLHLGGPDTITAFAIEDNELWLRHLLWLCVEVIVAGYFSVISLPNSSLLLPTLLVFVAGIIRYVERTWALYLGSNDGFKGLIPEKNPKDEDYYSKRSAAFEGNITNWRTESGHEKMVAYEFFQSFEFKDLIADLVLPSGNHGINESRRFFLDQKHEEAFTIMDIELGFAYDILYTKAQVVHKTVGYVTRAICFICVLASFLLFWFLPKQGIQKSDVKITYALLGGAMVLDVVALFNLIFSDWTFVFLLHKHPWLSGLRSYIGTITTYQRRLELKYVSQYNLIGSCVTKHKRSCGMQILQKLSQSRLAKKILDDFFHTYDEKVRDELKEFIFEELKKRATMVEELKKKAKMVVESKKKAKRGLEEWGRTEKWIKEELKEDANLVKKKIKEMAKMVEELKEKAATNVMESKKPWSCRGSLALEHYKSLKWTVDDVEFVESILLWHIATHHCYQNDRHVNENQGRAPVERRASKVISEYMVYLLVVHPSMISSMEGVRQIKLREAREGFTSSGIGFGLASQPNSERTYRLFPDACYLAQILSTMDVETRWQATSKVWVELLAHAASHCRANYHAKCLSGGGELLTYVWFLMAHLGSGQHYYEQT